MFKISGISFQQNYKINPLYERYLRDYKKYDKIYENLEYKIKYGKPEKSDFVDIEKAKRMKIALENQINSVPKILQGGNMKRDEAFAEAKQLHKIDFLA